MMSSINFAVHCFQNITTCFWAANGCMKGSSGYPVQIGLTTHRRTITGTLLNPTIAHQNAVLCQLEEPRSGMMRRAQITSPLFVNLSHEQNSLLNKNRFLYNALFSMCDITLTTFLLYES